MNDQPGKLSTLRFRSTAGQRLIVEMELRNKEKMKRRSSI